VTQIDTQRTRSRCWAEPCDPTSLERGVRQLLANKVSGNLLGMLLLVPEHLRLGTWDLVCGWADTPAGQVEPRLALQLVHEAALCVTGVREARSLAHKGFELANGLPFLATDQAIHKLLDAHTVAQAQELQVALGQLRKERGHFEGLVLACDPHDLRSHTARETQLQRRREDDKPCKVVQTFFLLDAHTCQPVCCTIGSSAMTIAQATPELLSMGARILNPSPDQTRVVADCLHLVAELIDHIHRDTPFDFLVPMANQESLDKRWRALPPELFTRHWPGYSTASIPYTPANCKAGPFRALVQRCGEDPDELHFKAFLSTANQDPLDALTVDVPDRWHIEEFYNAHQHLGWKRAGTLNLNIRYAQMSMALIAQAALHQLRQRLGAPIANWDSKHLAKEILHGLDGDVRVQGDTIIVTYYNARNEELLRQNYEDTPEKLAHEGIDPRVPWLHGFKIDFRFK
jgi:hypothetical protein